MNTQTENTEFAPDSGPDTLTEVRFGDLPINLRNLSSAKLWRSPTWSEIFTAIHGAVDEVPPGTMFLSSSVALLIPERNSGGRCFLYAGTTWAFISMLLDRVPTAVIVGGVSIQSSEEECRFVLPKDPLQPNPAKGGYHAWTTFVYEGEDYGVDMAYFWFKRHTSAVGPSRFFVARRTTLENIGINYHPSETLTYSLGLGGDMKRYAFLLGPVCANLRQLMGKQPLRQRIRHQLSSVGTWLSRLRELAGTH